jgi:hypothetical protein
MSNPATKMLLAMYPHAPQVATALAKLINFNLADSGARDQVAQLMHDCMSALTMTIKTGLDVPAITLNRLLQDAHNLMTPRNTSDRENGGPALLVRTESQPPLL